ncbi:MAG TPA: glycine cleavage T C-terminal barrel domain-containing protein, partial [bacterium]|nr:glycine cleavage T C-terminal barrel domain-containing protein [bacterium]
KRFPRHGYAVVSDGKVVGKVTSGGFSPSLQCGIALALVEAASAGADKDLKLDLRGQLVTTAFQKGPFYKRGSHK